MAILKYRYYDYDTFYEDGYPSGKLLAIDMEEDGVIYTYRVRDNECYVSEIKEGTEEITIADEIRVEGVGLRPVVGWRIPFSKNNCLHNIKYIKLGRNLKHFESFVTYDVENLKKLIIPESAESFPPFKNCHNLVELTMPDNLSLDLDKFAWSHPKLEKLILLHQGNQMEIDQKGLSAKRYLYQTKLDKEESDRIKEERRIAEETRHQDAIYTFTTSYIVIVCAIPYIWVIVNFFKKNIDFESDIIFIIIELFAFGVFVFGMFIAWIIAIIIGLYIVDYSKHKIITSIFVPILTVPLSWIIFIFALNLLSIFTSCSSDFNRIIDPIFI